MTDLTMIGLGAMGSALARAFLGAGHSVTVWNRSASKMEPLLSLNANAASNISEAIEASSIIVVCIDNYKLTKNLVTENNLGKSLSGRTLIQLSTGTPKEAGEFEAFLQGFDCEYIDGAIMGYPEEIGDKNSRLLFSGPEETYHRCNLFLESLGGDPRYLGPNICGAAAIDMALLTHFLSSFLGIVHGARICESENFPVEELAEMFPQGSAEKGLLHLVLSEKFEDTGATLNVWDGALQRVQTQAKDSMINSEVPDFISSFFKRAIAAGYGEEDVAAIIKVMRNNDVA